MARSTRAAPLLVLALGAVGLLAICRCPLGFTQPPAESRRSALFGGLAAATVAAGAQPAWAGAKFSLFGFGSEGNKAMSDAYSILDTDAYSPYSAFSGPSQGENLWKPYNDAVMEKKRGYVRESVARMKKYLPLSLASLNKEEVKMETTRQMYVLRDAANYLADGYKIKGDEGKAIDLKLKFFDEMGDLGVLAKLGKWKQASEKYEQAVNSLDDFTLAVGMEKVKASDTEYKRLTNVDERVAS